MIPRFAALAFLATIGAAALVLLGAAGLAGPARLSSVPVADVALTVTVAWLARRAEARRQPQSRARSQEGGSPS